MWFRCCCHCSSHGHSRHSLPRCLFWYSLSHCYLFLLCHCLGVRDYVGLSLHFCHYCSPVFVCHPLLGCRPRRTRSKVQREITSARRRRRWQRRTHKHNKDKAEKDDTSKVIGRLIDCLCGTAIGRFIDGL